jgi:hypothetical protein
MSLPITASVTPWLRREDYLVLPLESVVSQPICNFD